MQIAAPPSVRGVCRTAGEMRTRKSTNNPMRPRTVFSNAAQAQFEKAHRERHAEVVSEHLRTLRKEIRAGRRFGATWTILALCWHDDTQPIVLKLKSEKCRNHMFLLLSTCPSSFVVRDLNFDLRVRPSTIFTCFSSHFSYLAPFFLPFAAAPPTTVSEGGGGAQHLQNMLSKKRIQGEMLAHVPDRLDNNVSVLLGVRHLPHGTGHPQTHQHRHWFFFFFFFFSLKNSRFPNIKRLFVGNVQISE
jgi:hypothetical protein